MDFLSDLMHPDKRVDVVVLVKERVICLIPVQFLDIPLPHVVVE